VPPHKAVVRWKYPANPRSGKKRADDIQLPPTQTNAAQRLFVRIGRQPVVEPTHPPAERRQATGKRRPRSAEARTESGLLVDVRLQLVAQAGRDRQVLPKPDIVLQVDAALHHLKGDRWIADAPRIVARPVRQKRGQIVEGV